MKKQLLNLGLLFGIVILLSSCFGQHNNAPNPGVNLESERIYGEKGAEPRQLSLKYDADDGTVADRVVKIREKLYPTEGVKDLPTITLDSSAKEN